MAISEGVVQACRLFERQFGKPNRVYYPGCGNDSSPSTAFPGIPIVYCDPVQEGLFEIARESPKSVFVCDRAENAPADTFIYDLVLDVHSHAPFEAEIRDLRVGGYLLIANKKTKHTFEHPELELAAAINELDGYATLDAYGLERYIALDPNPSANSFSNNRLLKARFYVFRKIR